MDLLSTIRKEGSRGGVDFKWEDVSSSQHRENYLGHSLMAPVGRWQKGKDLSWYAKGDTSTTGDESADERRSRERKEEIRRIKEAEEDALAVALGLPVPNRNGAGGKGTGSNNIEVGELNKIIKDTETGAESNEVEPLGRGTGFGDFVGNTSGDQKVQAQEQEKGGLLQRSLEASRRGQGGGHEAESPDIDIDAMRNEAAVEVRGGNDEVGVQGDQAEDIEKGVQKEVHRGGMIDTRQEYLIADLEEVVPQIREIGASGPGGTMIGILRAGEGHDTVCPRGFFGGAWCK